MKKTNQKLECNSKFNVYKIYNLKFVKGGTGDGDIDPPKPTSSSSPNTLNGPR